MLLSEALNASGYQSPHGPIREEWLIVTCPNCERRNRLTEAHVAHPSAQQTIYSCLGGCFEPILSVEGTGYRAFGLLETEFPALPDEALFGKPEGF
jgi:hypothetical protein